MHKQPHRPRRARHVPTPAADTGAAQKPADAGASAAVPRRRRRRRIAAWILSGTAVLVILGLAAAGLYLRQLSTTFDDNRNVIEMDMEDDTAYRTSEGVLNILLLGSDSRGDSEEDYRERIGQSGERSDTMMFVHIPADRSGVYVMSLVRDLWVDVPGHGEGRINSALGVGGYPLVVDTVEELLDTHIDHIAIIDFEGFSDLTRSLGGVYVDNPRPFSAGQHNPSFYPEGTIRLEGDNALRFVRERKSFLDGDYARVENQQLVVKAIIDRFLSADTLTNPQRVMDVVNGIVPYLWMDEGLDSTRVAGYAMEMHSLRSQDIHMFTVPTGEPTTTSAGAQVILQDDEMMELLRRSLRAENMGEFMDYMEGLDTEGGPVLPEEGLGDPDQNQEDGAPDTAAAPGGVPDGS